MASGWSAQRLTEQLIANPALKVATSALGPRATRVAPATERPAGHYLHRLLACPSWSGRRLEPEEALSAAVASFLRKASLDGRLRAVWTRCPVEIRGAGRIVAMAQVLNRVLGVVSGAADFAFTWGGGGGWLELKVERPADLLAGKRRTYLRPAQTDFAAWCQAQGVFHAVCRSVDEVAATLRAWGVLACG